MNGQAPPYGQRQYAGEVKIEVWYLARTTERGQGRVPAGGTGKGQMREGCVIRLRRFLTQRLLWARSYS